MLADSVPGHHCFSKTFDRFSPPFIEPWSPNSKNSNVVPIGSDRFSMTIFDDYQNNSFLFKEVVLMVALDGFFENVVSRIARRHYLRFGGQLPLPLTRPIFCTNRCERVYITTCGCETGFQTGL